MINYLHSLWLLTVGHMTSVYIPRDNIYLHQLLYIMQLQLGFSINSGWIRKTSNRAVTPSGRMITAIFRLFRAGDQSWGSNGWMVYSWEYHGHNTFSVFPKQIGTTFPSFHSDVHNFHHFSIIHRIGWWENLQETLIFDGKNHGFL